jgi:hypothetical protein
VRRKAVWVKGAQTLITLIVWGSRGSLCDTNKNKGGFRTGLDKDDKAPSWRTSEVFFLFFFFVWEKGGWKPRAGDFRRNWEISGLSAVACRRVCAMGAFLSRSPFSEGLPPPAMPSFHTKCASDLFCVSPRHEKGLHSTCSK